MDSLMSILDDRFNIEIIDRKSDYEITYHESITKDVQGIVHIQPLLSKSMDLFHCINLPVALKLKNKKEYQMVARYWVLQYVIDKKKMRFPAIVFEDPELVPAILELETLENDYFMKKDVTPREHRSIPKSHKITNTSSKKQLTSKSRATNRRHATKDSERTCPFCPGPLAKATGRYITTQGDLLTQDGPNTIKCGYSSNKRYKCAFVATMTNIEFADFKNTKKKYPTQEWLVLVPRKRCPVCGDEVYRRTIHKDNGKIEIWERCRKINQSTGRTCSWKFRIQ